MPSLTPQIITGMVAGEKVVHRADFIQCPKDVDTRCLRVSRRTGVLLNALLDRLRDTFDPAIFKPVKGWRGTPFTNI